MKKRLLFVIDSLGIGGAEKSLLTLLNCIDSTKYEIDLQLFSKGGEFEKFLPKNITILPNITYLSYCSKSIASTTCPKYFFSRLSYSLKLIFNKTTSHPDKAMLFWKSVKKSFKKNDKQYDVAIAYSQGVPTFYVADKVNATKKIAWVNSSLLIDGKTLKFNQEYYNKYNKIVAVSNSAKEILCLKFSNIKEKTHIIYDIVDPNTINQLASECVFDLRNSRNQVKILTVARLNNKHKGYDIALNVAKILNERGVDFIWYAVGEGGFRSEMETFVKENNLTDKFVLLGAKGNPYPYFRECDLYVQTSRHEGFGLSIAEAKILNKPVVTTEFDAVWNQMVQGKNGIVVPIDATAVADAIQDLIEHPEKMKEISDYQRTEKKGNIEELEKFYQLIES